MTRLPMGALTDNVGAPTFPPADETLNRACVHLPASASEIGFAAQVAELCMGDALRA